MKKSLGVFYVGAVVLAVVGLSACNTAPPPSSANGYVLEVIPGNTSLDETLFSTNTNQSLAANKLRFNQL